MKIVIPADKLAKALVNHMVPAAIRGLEKRLEEVKAKGHQSKKLD